MRIKQPNVVLENSGRGFNVVRLSRVRLASHSFTVVWHSLTLQGLALMKESPTEVHSTSVPFAPHPKGTTRLDNERSCRILELMNEGFFSPGSRKVVAKGLPKCKGESVTLGQPH